jgi:hypothetical protein
MKPIIKKTPTLPGLRLTRRQMLHASAALGGASLLPRLARGQSAGAPADRLLFVVCATGGGNIVDSFLPVADTESQNASTLAVQPASFVRQPDGSNLRCVANRGGTVAELPAGYPISQELFLQRNAADTVVMCVEGTSVNHRVAQHRALTGAGADRGRTILEAVADRHGQGMLLPNINMAADGYLEPGTDPTLPVAARGEPVANALLFPFQTHGVRGLGLEQAVGADRLARVRGLRDTLETQSPFGRTFEGAPARQRYLDQRSKMATMEASDLIRELMMVEDDDMQFPLGRFGLEASPAAADVREIFPNAVDDTFEAQAALAYLLARAGVGASFAIAPTFQPNLRGATLVNTPLAFDFSHADHQGTQNVMWSRVLAVVDGLVRLLKATPAGGSGASLWDRSLIYIATDFGRDKVRPANASTWGTGHHLNNAVVMLSPLLNANRVYGGIDPDTLLTYGFDPSTGEPAPGTVMREGDVYSAIAQAMDVSFEGRRDMSAMIKNG